MQQSRDVRPAVATLDPPPARHPHGSDPASSLLPPPPTRQPGEESSRASAGPSPVRPGGGEEEDGGADIHSPQDLSRKDGVGVPAAERRYECRHCHLATRDLAVFSAHVDSAHPGVLANPLYVCRSCRFRSSLRSEFDAHNRRRHRSLGCMKLRITKMPDRTVLEQSPVGRALDVDADDGDDCKRRSAETSPATPAVAQPSGDDAEVGAVPNPSGLSARRSPRPTFEKPNDAEPRRRLTDAAAENGAAAWEPAAKTAAAAVPRSQQHQQRQEDRAGGLQIFNPALPHIVLNASKIAQGDPAFTHAAFDGVPTAERSRGGGATEVDAATTAAGSEPVSSPADDAGRMDGDRHLLAAFARFPYPSSGDIAWLASVTPFAEGRLRGWFAARRAARAISWSPGEIEERRRRLVASTMATLLMSGPGAETHDGPGAQPDVAAASKQPATGEGQPPSALVADRAAAVTPVELPTASPDDSAARAHESSSSSTSSPLALALTVSASSAASSVRSPSPSMAPSASSSSSSPPPDRAPPSVSPEAPVPPPCRGPRGKHKKSKEQLARLKRSFARNRHPDEGELRRLVGATGLGRSEVKKWFSDGRYRAGGDGYAGPRRPSTSRFFHRNLPTMCPLEFVGRMSIVDSLNRAAKARHCLPGEDGGGVGGEEKAAGAAAVTAAAAAARAAAEEEYEVEETTTDGRESADKFDAERPSASECNGDEEEPAALVTLAGSPDGRQGNRSEPGGAGGRAAEEATDADEEVRGFYGDEPARVGARPRPAALDCARPAGGPHPEPRAEPRGRLIAKIKIPRNGGNYEHVKPSLSGEIRAGLRGGCSASAPPAHAALSAYSNHTAHTMRTTLIAQTAHSAHTTHSTHSEHSTHTAHSEHSTHTAHSEQSAHTAQSNYSHFTHSAHFTHPAHSENSTHSAHTAHAMHSAHTTHASAHEAHASHVSAHGTHAAHGTLTANATLTHRPRNREFTPPPPEPRFGPERHQRPGCPGLLDAPGRRTAVVKPSVRRPKKTKEQLSVLKAVFRQTQWPTPEEYVALVARTGLPRSDIVRWFGDTRFAYKHGQLRWIRGQRSEPVDGRAAARTRPARGRGSRRHDVSPEATIGARLAGEFPRSPDGHGGCCDSAERGKAALYRFHVDTRASYMEPSLVEEEAGGGAGRRGEGNGAGERR